MTDGLGDKQETRTDKSVWFKMFAMQQTALVDKQPRVGLELIEETWSDEPFTIASPQITGEQLCDGLNSLTRPSQTAECLKTLTKEGENWFLSVSEWDRVTVGSKNSLFFISERLHRARWLSL